MEVEVLNAELITIRVSPTPQQVSFSNQIGSVFFAIGEADLSRACWCRIEDKGPITEANFFEAFQPCAAAIAREPVVAS